MQQGQPQQGQYPPAGQQGYGQPPPPQQTVYVQPTTIVTTSVRDVPVRMQCPACRADIMTGLSYDTGLLVWLLCGVMFIFGFWLCCFIPFCIDQCKDVVHTCPNCSHVVGKYSRLG